MGSAKLHVVDDDLATRDSIRTLLATADYEVETYDSAPAFLDKVRPTATGCILLDLEMPGMSGMDMLEGMRRLHFAMPTIIVTAHGEIRSAVQAMQAGAVDFLIKPFMDDVLLARIRGAIAGVDEQERRSVLAKLAALTKREGDVFASIVNGNPNKVLAYELGVSVRTVEVHRAHVMIKMEASSLAELVRMSLRVPDALAALEGQSQQRH